MKVIPKNSVFRTDWTLISSPVSFKVFNHRFAWSIWSGKLSLLIYVLNISDVMVHV